MLSGWFARLFFAVVAALAVAGVVSGTACTRWGHPGAVPATLAPISAIYVDAHTGSDTSGNGSATTPFKTLTKAVEVLVASKVTSGITIHLANGNYDHANGEVFPIVVPKSVTISGNSFGSGPKNGAFINGYGEDTTFEKIVHAPPRSAFTTLEIVPPASVNLGDVYVGATKITLPKSTAFYVSLNVFGTVSGSDAGFGSGVLSALRAIDGVMVAGGSFTCSSCQIRGNDFGIAGFSLIPPSPSPSPTTSPTGPPTGSPPPYSSGPTITLSHAVGDSTISAKEVDITTDGSANVTVSGQAFERGVYAFSDAYPPVISTTFRGALDFGGGIAGSSGGNAFIGARTTEIFITRRGETASALDNFWNSNQQMANRNGLYTRMHVFGSGASGRNVTIRSAALGSTVTVGPAVVPTPTPSISPSASPTSSPT